MRILLPFVGAALVAYLVLGAWVYATQRAQVYFPTPEVHQADAQVRWVDSQDERLKALAAFKAGEIDLLVATDVAARGLDIADLPAVFNFDVPFNAEDYVHRIGRTGRAGASGLAVTLVARDDSRLIADIEKLIKKKVELEPFELEDLRPRRPPRRDEPVREEGDRGEPRAIQPAPPPRRAPAPSSDPFFSQPYESKEDAQPAWERSTAAATTPSGLSRYIKAKKRVASLLGGKS